MGVKLPRWVWVGAVTLACIAGMVNVVGYLGFEHLAVSHLTGTTSLLGAALAYGDWKSSGHLWAMLIAFSLGATLSGLIIQDSTLRLGRRHRHDRNGDLLFADHVIQLTDGLDDYVIKVSTHLRRIGIECGHDAKTLRRKTRIVDDRPAKAPYADHCCIPLPV